MSPKINPGLQSALKAQRLREIVSLLKDRGPLEAKDIAAAIPNLSIYTASRYLDELLLIRNIRRIQAPGKPKNFRAYEYSSEYGSKNDIVSSALTHPMHRIMLSVFKRRNESR